MNIECPDDYDFAATENRFISCDNTFKAPDINLNSKQKRKKRRPPSFTEAEEMGSKRKQKKEKKEDLLQGMYKEAKKKMYVNLFVRKIKQLVVASNQPQHRLLEESPNLHPTKLLSFKWNLKAQVVYTLFMIVHILVACIATSLGLAFPEIVDSNSLKTISALTVFSGLLEIFLNFTTRSSLDIQAVKTKRVLISEVGWRYTKKWFTIDAFLVGIFAADLFTTSPAISYCKFTIILKLIPMIEKMRNLQIIFIENCFKEQYWELIKVFLGNFLFAHFLAIILILMTNGQKQSWLTHNGLSNQPWHHQYVWSYYWATTIMLTVGFGDLTPTNISEVLVIIFIQTFSCIFLAYNINSVGTIIKKITSYEEEKMNNLKIFTQMEAKEDISEDTKNKVTNYIIQSAEMKRNYNIDEENALLTKLPQTFYDQFKQESIAKIFDKLPYFRNLPMPKLREISMYIQKKLTHPEEVILHYSRVPDVIIANNGTIALTMNRPEVSNHGKEIQVFNIGKKDFKILSLYFFSNQAMNYDVMCKNYTIIYSIRKQTLQSVLSTSPYCYQIYCMGRDKDRFNPNDLETEICELCTETKARHTFFDCPKLHFIPIRNIVVDQTLKKNPQKMKEMMKWVGRKRVPKTHMSSLKLYSELEGGFYEKQIFQLANTICKKLIEPDGVIFRRGTSDLSNSDSLSKRINLRKLSMSTLCQKMGQKIKQQVIRTAFPSNSVDKFAWQLESDIAHDFEFYFYKQNPSSIAEQFKKKHRKRQQD